MKAIIYEEFGGELFLNNVTDPTPENHGCVIKVFATGLCLSDWHGWKGHDKDIKLPHVPGHELAGIVEAVGKDVRNFQIGDRVTVPFVGGCGKCSDCSSGNHQICMNQFQPGFTHWGSYAEYVGIHYADTNLVKLPDEISFVTAASLGCRFATAFRAVIDQGKVSGGQWVAVHGCGGVGLSAIMIARAQGAQVIAIDINQAALEMAKKMGASIVLNSREVENLSEAVLELTKGGAHVSLDAIGTQDTLLNSVRNLRKRGKHVQVGIMEPNETMSKIPIDLLIAKELEVLGSHGMQAHRYNDMINMIQCGVLKPDQLISEEVSLHDALQYLPKMREISKPGIKVITKF